MARLANSSVESKSEGIGAIGTHEGVPTSLNVTHCPVGIKSRLEVRGMMSMSQLIRWMVAASDVHAPVRGALIHADDAVHLA